MITKTLASLAITVAAAVTLSSNEATAKSSVAHSIAAARASIAVSKVTPVNTPNMQSRNFQITQLVGRPR